MSVSELVNIEVLRERFPSEIVNPYGEVLVIPRRLFQRGWESALEAEGHRVYAGDYNGEAAFLVRVLKAESRKVEHYKPENGVEVTKSPSSDAKVDTWRRWTPEEIQRLQEMLQQGLGVDKIAETLDRTTFAVERKIQRLRRKDFNLPETESGAVAPIPAPNPVAVEDHVIKEFLVAASELYPRYRYACRFLLLETSRLLEKGQGEKHFKG